MTRTQPPLLLLPDLQRRGECLVCEFDDAVAESQTGVDAQIRGVLFTDNGVVGKSPPQDRVDDGLRGVVTHYDSP